MLEKLTNWFREQIIAFFVALQHMLEALFYVWVQSGLNNVVFIFQHLPALPFLEGETLGSILGRAGPVVGWTVATFRIGESLSVLGTAMAFYIVRRILTLGIW